MLLFGVELDRIVVLRILQSSQRWGSERDGRGSIAPFDVSDRDEALVLLEIAPSNSTGVLIVRGRQSNDDVIVISETISVHHCVLIAVELHVCPWGVLH